MQTMENTVMEQPAMLSEVTGSGDPLVLIGGGLTGWASWQPHAARLAPTRRVARLQLLSVQYGLEDRPLGPGYSIQLESDAFARALDDLGWREPLDLVGWSYGASITLNFALAHPDRVRTLTLIEPNAVWLLPAGGEDDSDVRALREMSIGESSDVNESDLETFVRSAGLAPPGTDPRGLPQWSVWFDHRRSLRSGPAVFSHRNDIARLRSFNRPTLLVTGTGATPFLRRIVDIIAAELPWAEVVEMPAGHAPQVVSMDEFLVRLDEFQRRDDPVATAGGDRDVDD